MTEEIKIAGPPYVFRFRQNTDRTIDEIANNYIYFPDRDSLNDPYDSSHELVYLTKNPEATMELYKLVAENIKDNRVKSYFKTQYDEKALQEFAQEKVKDLILEFGIVCFSMYMMNLPLWANYANDHKGVCLQFNCDYDKNFFSVLGPVYYEDELTPLEFSPITDGAELEKVFFRKAKSWEYEKEIRLIKGFKGKEQFDKNALRNVILGYNAEEEYIKNIYQAVKENYQNVGVYKMEKPTKINKLTLTEIK